jgi:hypothetical protein
MEPGGCCSVSGPPIWTNKRGTYLGNGFPNRCPEHSNQGFYVWIAIQIKIRQNAFARGLAKLKGGEIICY